MALIQTTSYASKKGAQGTSTSSAKGYANTSYTNISTEFAVSADRLTTPRNIWGQPFDGSADITGSFLLDGNNSMTVYGPWKAGSYYAKEVSYLLFQPTQNAAEFSDLFCSRTNFDMKDSPIHIYSNDNSNFLNLDASGILHRLVNSYGSFTAQGISWTGGQPVTISADGELSITAQKINLDLGNGDIKANSVYTNNLYDNGTGSIYVGSPMILDEGLEINGDLTVEHLYSQNITNEHEIRTRDLTVTGQLSVFDLVVEQVSAAGGCLVLSAANMKVDDIANGRTVQTSVNYGVAGSGLTDASYQTMYLYQINVNPDTGEKIRNLWKAGDHALCYTANVDEEASDVDIRAWWTLVYSVQTDVIRNINGEDISTNMIEIVTKVTTTDSVTRDPSFGAVTVQKGDSIALLGSHNTDRQAAIILASHDTFDVNFTAPCIVQYQNINGFTLTGKAKTYFAKNGNRIQGSLVVDSTGQSVEDMIAAIEHGYETYLHIAYADDDQGTNFTLAEDVTGTNTYAWIGLCSDTNSDASSYTYTDFTWTRINDGNERDKLIPVRERLYLASNDKLYLDVAYLTSMWTSNTNTVSAVITTYGGSTTTRNVNNVSGTTVYYTDIVQNDWSTVQNENRYAYATIYLKDANNNILDQKAIQLVFEAGAVLSITDTIKSRVSNAEGSISTLVQRADSITSRVSNVEGSVSTLVQDASSLSVRIQHAEDQIAVMIDPESVTVDIADMKSDINQLKIDVNGLQQTTSSLTQTTSGLSSTINEFRVGQNGLENRLQTVEQTTSNLDGALVTTRDQVSILTQRIDNIKLDVKDVMVGGENLLNCTDFGNIPDEDVKAAWTTSTSWMQNHSSGVRKSIIVEKNQYGPLADGTIGYIEVQTNPTGVADAANMFDHDYYGKQYVDILTQDITGKLKPSTWYTMSFECKMKDYENLHTYIYPNVGNTNYHHFINGKEQTGYPKTDVDVSWINDAEIPASNGWKRVSVTFKTRDDLSLTASHYVTFRAFNIKDSSNNWTYPQIYIAHPKLEEGNVATAWSQSAHDWESMIDIRANKIALNVRDGLKNTGIDIESGLISLNADKTEINGTLNIFDNSGLTVYDEDNIPRVQIKPVYLGGMDSYSNDTVAQITQSGYYTTNAQSRISVQTTERSFVVLQQNQTVKVRDMKVDLAYQPQGQEYQSCTSQTCTATVSILYQGSQVFEKVVTLIKYGNEQFYSARTEVLSFRASTAGTYTINAIIVSGDTVPAQSNCRAIFRFNLEQTTDHQTVIGLDGMCAYAGYNKNMWVGEDGIRLQYGGSGIKFQGALDNNKGMQVLARNDMWLPFYNYVPLFNPVWTYQYIPHIKGSRYAYAINPFNDVGYCYITVGPNYNNDTEGWILLPDREFPVGPVIKTIPIGYRVKIINCTCQNTKCTIYVTTANPQDTYKQYDGDKAKNIIDDNNNFNVWVRLRDAGGMSDEFIFDGHYWRQLKDTQ